MATVIGDLFVRIGVDMTALSGNLNSAEARLEKFGTSMFFLGSRVTAGITIPMTAAAAAIMKFGLDFDTAMTESLAIMGEIDAGMRGAMENVAMSIAKTSKFSATEGAEGFYHLASAGLSATQSMAALPIVTQFAQAGVMDLAKSAEFLAGAQAALAMTSDDTVTHLTNMTRIADVLTKANNIALGTIEDFAAALTNKAGAALRLVGKDVEEGVAVLAAYADQNIKGKAAGQQLWMVMRDLGTYALKNADDFKQYGISVFDSTGAMKNMATIIGDVERAVRGMSDAEERQMFLSLGIPLRSVAATQALVGYSAEIARNEAILRSAGGTTEEVANKQMVALENRLLALYHQFQNQATLLFQQFVPVFDKYLIPALETALGWFEKITTALSGMDDGWKLAILGALGLVAAIGPVVAFIGSFSLLTSAAVGGIKILVKETGELALKMGLAAGGMDYASMSAKQIQAHLTGVGIAARDSALAMGRTAFQANAAGASAMAAERHIIKMAVSSAEAGAAATTFGRALGGLGVWLERGAAFLATWVPRLAGMVAGFLKWYAIIEIVSAALGELFEGWGKKSEDAAEKTSLFGEALGVVSTAFGIFDDAVKITAGLTAEFIELLKETASLALNDFKSKIDADKKAMENMGLTWDNLIAGLSAAFPTFAAVFRKLDEWADKIKNLSSYVEDLKSWWDMLKFSVELRDTPQMDILGAEMQKLMKQRAAEKHPMASMFFPAPTAPKQDIGFLSNALMSTAEQQAFKDKYGYLPWQPKPAADDTDLDTPGKPKRMTRDETADQNLRNQLLGINEEAQRLERIWNSLDESQRGNIKTQFNLWEAYSKTRTEVGGQIPAFERLFAAQIEQQKLDAHSAQARKNWTDQWSAGAHEMIDEAPRVVAAMKNMTSPQVSRFWDEHSKVMDEMQDRYHDLSPEVQTLVRQYQLWKAALPPGAEFQEAARKASQSLTDMTEDVDAKLGSVQSQLADFGETSGVLFVRQRTSKLKEMEANFEQSNRKMEAELSRFSGEQLTIEQAKFVALKGKQKEYLGEYERLETFKYAVTVGVSDNILRKHKDATTAELEEIIKRQVAWNDFFRDLAGAVNAIKGMGNLATLLGLEQLGAGLTGVGGGIGNVVAGMTMFQRAGGDVGQQIAGITQMVGGAIEAWQALSDTAGRANRAMVGALSGAQLGGSIGGWWGAAIGGLIGGLVGLFKGDPSWAKLQDTVRDKWRVSVSDELAKQIDETARDVGSRTTAMFLHIGDVIKEAGGLNAGNVNKWAGNLAQVFVELERGSISSANAAKALDSVFGEMVANGTTTTGFLSDQVRELVQLEQKYKSGSAAVKEFINSQLGLVTEGFGNIVGGTFGHLMGLIQDAEAADTAMEKTNGLHQKAAKLRAQIADYEKEGTKNEKQRVALAIARVELLRTEWQIRQEQAKQAAADAAIGVFMGAQGTREELNANLAEQNRLRERAKELQEDIKEMELEGLDTGAKKVELAQIHNQLLVLAKEASMIDLTNISEGQEQFDRMGRLALVTFDAMIGSGKTLTETLDAMGPSIDTLIAAQETFGLTSSEAFTQLMKFREFATVHPELIQQLDGINQMMVGLHNTSFLTEEAFNDLGAIAVDVFEKMTANGLTADEAFQFMQPTLQRLWELQRNFGYEVDAATQLLLDEAEASGVVGEKYMSANDRMVLGIDKLISRFELFLKHLGIDVPDTAQDAADAMNTAFDGVNPDIVIEYSYRPKPGMPGPAPDDQGEYTYTDPRPPRPDYMLAEGGVIDRPTFVAGEDGAEVVMPLNELFDQLDSMYASPKYQDRRIGDVYLDGHRVGRVMLPILTKESDRHVG